MENPSITMSIDEGPKKGETLDCSNGRVIRIGRVIRGNTLAVKDPGISQKHLTVSFHRRISRWTVTDHNTSNGTAVNGAVISTDTPFPLADGDIITIGYKTSISVKILDLTLVPAPSTSEKEAGKVIGSISKQDVDVKKISAPILAPEPRMRRGRRVVVADVTSPMEVEKNFGRGSIKQDVDVKKISDLTLAPDHRTKRRRVSAAVTSLMEKEKVVEMEKQSGKGGSDKQNVDVKEISAPSLGSDHRMKRGRRTVAAAVTSLMEKEEEKVVELEKQSEKGGLDKQNVDVKKISAPSLASDHQTKRGRRTVAAALTSLMEKEKAVEMEKQSGKCGSYFARGSIKQDVDVKEISAPSLAPETRKRRGRITVTSLMEKGKVVEAEKQAGKGGSYCARGSIEEDVDVKEISAPTLVLDHRAKRGKRTVAATVSSPMEEEKVVVEKQAGKGGSYCARGSIEQDVDVKEISAPTLVSDHRAKRGRRTVAAAVTSPMEEEKVVEVEKQAGKGGCYSARSSIKQDVKEISAPILAPAPRTKRGRRITYLMEEEKVVETEKQGGKGGSYSGKGSIKQDVENHRKGQVQRKRGIESTGVCRNDKALEPVAVEGDTKSAEVRVGVLKEKDEERGAVHDNAEGKTKNGGRGRSRVKISADSTTVLPKGAPLEPVDVKCKTRQAVKALPIPKEDDEALEMIEGVVKDGGKGPAHTKRGGGSARISWKDEVPEPAVPRRRGKVTRASTMIKEDEKETKEEKVQKTIKNRVKQTEISKKGGRSTRISRKDEVSESVEIEEKIVGSLSSHLEVTEAIQKEDVIVELGKKKKKSNVKDNPIVDGEMLAVRRDVSFAVEETDNHKDAIMFESNRSSDLDLPNKKELVYSWSSFSEIRGIPNTTSKYREDRMINCHATPFEARVERALNKGISGSSSSVDIEA